MTVPSNVSVQSTIKRAIECFGTGRYVESNDLLFPLSNQVRKNSHISFYVGRNYLYLGKDVEAEEWLSRSLSSDPPFPWTYYELARLKNRQGDHVAAARQMGKFLQCGSAAELHLNAVHQETIVAIANRCFGVHREAAVDLYHRINLAGMPTYLSELRVIEDLTDKKRTNAAFELMLQLQTRHTPDAWGLFALSRLLHLRGDTDAAIATVHKAIESQADNHFLKVMACHRFFDFGRLSDAEEYFRSVLSNSAVQDANLQRDIEGIKFRLHVRNHRYEELLAEYSQPGALANIPNWIVVEAAFEFTLPGEQITPLDLQVATCVAQHLEGDSPYSLGTILALLLFYSRRRLWDRAVDLLDRIRNEALFDHPEIVMRRFEMLCSMSKLDEARSFYLEHYSNKKIGQWESCVVLRFLAEAKMWDEAGDLLVEFIESGFYFPDGEYFLLRICRRKGLHLKLLDIIERFPAPDAPPQFANLHQLLIDDVCVALGREEFPASERLGSVQGRRLSNQNAVLLKPESARLDRVIGFLCTDKAYFFSALTFLASYAINNPKYKDTLHWAVFLDRDVPTSWATAVSKFSRKLGLNLRTVSEPKFMRSNVMHIERYGIFTGGNTLSRAAFMRIYAAKYLYETGKFSRAFYLDTDIVCQTDLSDFLNLEFGQSLIMAKTEEDSPEVRDAATKHALQESSYFNSGVLIFNFSNAEISSHLDHAIRLSEREPERLVFHDQCALNIAFAGRVRYLEKKHNFFLRPHRPDNGDYSAAILLHYLDRPKPWDITYGREYRESWLPYASIVRMLLPHEFHSEIVAVANGDSRQAISEFTGGIEVKAEEAPTDETCPL